MRDFQFYFPTSKENDIASSQNLSANEKFTFNGFLGNITSTVVDFASKGYSRSIRVTATVTAATNIMVSGRQNGRDIVEFLAFTTGTNTVASTQIFDQINSVIPSGAITNASIRTGTNGAFPLLKPDLNIFPLNASFRIFSNNDIDIGNATPIANDNVTIFSSFLDRENNGQTFLEQFSDDNSSDELQLLTRGTGIDGTLLPTGTDATKILTLRFSERPIFNYLVHFRNIQDSTFIRLVFLQTGE